MDSTILDENLFSDKKYFISTWGIGIQLFIIIPLVIAFAYSVYLISGHQSQNPFTTNIFYNTGFYLGLTFLMGFFFYTLKFQGSF